MSDATDAHRDILTRFAVRPEYQGGLGLYGAKLLQINEQINLTGAKSFEEFALKHLADIHSAVEAYEAEHEWPEEVWDIGSGGGIPGIPLAIMRSNIQVTLVERREKKARVLSDLVNTLGLEPRVRIVCNSFELISERSPLAECWFRGFLPAEKLITYFSNHVPEKKLKRVVLMKGPSWPQELKAALSVKGIKNDWIERFQNSYTVEYALPENAGSRCLVFL